MASTIRPAIAVFLALTIVTGILYPLAITGVAQATFPAQANGSLIVRSGMPVGSSLIGQDFSGGPNAPRDLWGRPSATAPVGYTPFNAATLTGSSGSNLAPTNPAIVDNALARIAAMHAADVAAGYDRPIGQLVPVDLVTSSASGLDPHISSAAAEYQVPRIARARGMSEDAVRAIVTRFTEGRWLSVVGEPRVNVLWVNLALDEHGSVQQ